MVAIEAHQQRERSEWLRTAWLASTLPVTVWAGFSGKGYTPQELIPWLASEQEQQKQKEEAKRAAREAAEAARVRSLWVALGGNPRELSH